MGGAWIIFPIIGLFMMLFMMMMMSRARLGREYGQGGGFGPFHPEARWTLMILGVMVMMVGLALIVVVLGGSGAERQGYATTGPFMGPGMMGRGMGSGMMGEGYAPPPAVAIVPTATPGGNASVSYRQDVQPIFDRACVACHGGSAGLWLDSYEHVLAGSSLGPVVTPDDPDASELYRRIIGQSQPGMPLNGTALSLGEIEIIRTWITEGAPNN
jgi:mono/diheme cytochrome c family protein